MPNGLHIQTLGKKGPHLAMLHGWGMNNTVWMHTAQQLSKHFRVHLIDLPGMGNSESITPYTLDTVTETIAEHLPNQTIVIGWSLGGLLAMHIAIHHPDAISKLVLIGATPCFVNVQGLTTRLHWSAGVELSVFKAFAKNVKADYQKAMLNFLALQCVGSERANQLLRQLKTDFSQQPVPEMDDLQQALTILKDTDLRQIVHEIGQPTLIIHGDKDRLAPLQAGNWLAQAIPNTQIRVINGAAHAPFLSHDKIFQKELFDFLKVKKSLWQMFSK